MVCVVSAILMVLLAVQVNCERGYIIVAPKVMVLGSTEKVCITPVDVTENFLIEVDIEIEPSSSRNDDRMKFITEYMMTDKDHCIDIQIPDKQNLYTGLSSSRLKVVGKSLNPEVQFRFSEEKGIWLKSHKPNIFIQTDKPMYNPGQTVKLRILNIKGNKFLPYLGMLSTVFIENPSGVRLMQWLNVTTENGLVQLEMPLSEEPVMGTWKIKAELEGHKKTQTFEVKEYVLPKFEVIIKSPPYILISDETIDVEICGRYTYGQPVKGEVLAKICLTGMSYWHWYNARTERPCIRKEKENTGADGCVKFSVNTEDLELRSHQYPLWSSHLKVDASFTEVVTGVVFNVSKEKADISTQAFKLAIEAPESFKPGVPFYGEVKVTNLDNSPASGKLINLLVSTNHGNIFREDLTSVNGVIEFSLLDVAVDTTRMTIEASEVGHFSYNYHSYSMTKVSTSKSIRPWYSPSQSFLQIEPVEETVAVDSAFDFTVYYTTKEVQLVQLFYKVISRGDIVQTGSVNYELNPEYDRRPGKPVTRKTTTIPTTTAPEPTTTATLKLKDYWSGLLDAIVNRTISIVSPTIAIEEPEPIIAIAEPEPIIAIAEPEPTIAIAEPEPTIAIAEPGSYSTLTLTLPISPDMSPNSKLLIYYVREDGEVIADGISFQVQQKFDNEVNLRFTDDEALPGAVTQLELSASPGSLCAVGVVDKSVHLMKSSNQLTKSMVLSTVKEFDLSNINGYVDENTHCDSSDDYYWYDYFEERGKRDTKPAGPSRQKKSSWYPHYYDSSSDYDDSLKAFENSNLVIMTNALLETRPCPERVPRRHPYYDEYSVQYTALMTTNVATTVLPPMTRSFQTTSIMMALEENAPTQMEPMRPVLVEVEDEIAEFTPLVEIRTYFPETWLWMLEIIGETGSSTVDVEVPHTITEWIGSGFCTSSQDGVGVSETAHLTAFQPFFLSYTLPYSVIREEKVPVVISVFNYLSQCLTIELTLTLTEDFEMLDEAAVKRICVCGSESETISYYIVPSTLGEIPITVHAESVGAEDFTEICGNEAIMSDQIGVRDALSDELLVEPEGIEEEYTYSLFFCPSDEEGTYGRNIELELPDNVIEGSARGVLSIIGDLMGPTLSGLDKLLKVPYGCGEQNMVTFSPNIFVLQYLTQTDQVTKEIEDKAHANILRGYQRELTYRHRDGSYSAFGERDPEGSTWLTAFVVKSFAQSSQFITIDKGDLDVSIAWFKAQQNPTTGCFMKRGTVLHKLLKGGVSGETSLTAFVVIAMLEAGIPRQDYSLQLALRCLETRLDNITEIYSITILSYALALARSERTEYIMNKLDDNAIQSDDLLYWAVSQEVEEEESNRRWYHTAPSHDVEMTSYALLAKLVIAEEDSDRIAELLPIVRWLTKQRNAYGGFSSTQDTILALQALAIYGGLVYRDGIDMYVDFQANDLVQRFSVNHDNKLVLQRVEVPTLPGIVAMTAAGDGCALMQANVKYNIPKSPAPPKFHLEVNVLAQSSTEINSDKRSRCAGDKSIQICARYLGNDESSNMAVIETKMVSGYFPDKISLRNAFKSSDSMARFDIDGNKVIFYFDEIGHDTICFEFVLQQVIKVEDVKPGWVSVYDYYDTDTSAIVTYDICQSVDSAEDSQESNSSESQESDSSESQESDSTESREFDSNER